MRYIKFRQKIYNLKIAVCVAQFNKILNENEGIGSWYWDKTSTNKWISKSTEKVNDEHTCFTGSICKITYGIWWSIEYYCLIIT